MRPGGAAAGGVRVERLTSAAPSAVWRVLADPCSYAGWVAGTAAIRHADGDWPAVGSRLHHRFGPRVLGVRDRTTVLACEPGQRLVLDAAALPLGRVHAEIRVTRCDDRTKVELRESPLAGLVARFPRLGHAIQVHRNRRSLRDLVRKAERGAI